MTENFETMRPMTGDELREAIAKIDNFGTFGDFARWLDIDERTPRRWFASNPPPPLGVAMLLRIMIHYGITPVEARAIGGPKSVRRRKPRGSRS